MAGTYDSPHAEQLALTGELVCATGICSVCDYRFKNKVVLRYRSSTAPCGWVLLEPRHLHDGTYADMPARLRA